MKIFKPVKSVPGNQTSNGMIWFPGVGLLVWRISDRIADQANVLTMP
ncbi:MAG: hypothetical protein AAB306_03890 [Pseudomonadota bacterium]